MPGGFPLGPEICGGTDVGTGGTSSGTTLTSGAANTMGSYTQLIAATARDACWIVIMTGSGSVATPYAVDVAIGAAGSEKVIAPQLISSSGLSDVIAIPCSIPAGTRIAARCQCVTASSTIAASVLLFDGAFTQMEGCAGVDAIGFNAGTTLGSAVTASGSINTKGTYTQMIAATARDYIGLWAAFDTVNAAANRNFLVDIAIGAGGSEQVIVPNLAVRGLGALSTMWFMPNPTPFFPIPIPAGTRLAARCQSSTASAAFNMTLYGLYK